MLEGVDFRHGLVAGGDDVAGEAAPGEVGAGKPVSCISNYYTRDMEVIDGVALVYRTGSTIYVTIGEGV